MGPGHRPLGAAGAKATFKDSKGKGIGSATLAQTPNGVLIDIDESNLPEGEHAFHIHQALAQAPAR